MLTSQRQVLRGAVVAALLALPAPAAGQEGAGIGAALRRAIAAVPIPADGATAHGLSRAALRRLYGDSLQRPLWTDGGRPTPQAQQVLDLLEGSEARGLRPADYGVTALREGLDGLARASAPADADVARVDVGLSVSLMRLVAHLHAGRVNPRALRFNLPETHSGLDLVALVRPMAGADDVDEAVRAVEPPYAGYRALVEALARYRALASGPDPRPPVRREVVRPGDRYPEAVALARYLAALGDLPPERVATLAADTAPRLDAELVEGLVAFQLRHALDADGVLGPATMAALRVPLAQRVRQIELTLERWRWMPDVLPERLVVVNVPAFRLFALERAAAGRPVLRMNVIVGEAERRRFTPLFVGTMREVVFRPYWDVPPSIARGELLPRIRRRPGYLEREELEIVRGGDHDAVVYAPTAANFARVASGYLRLRQRPGPKNALGAVKFVFPNPYNVYLHGTPAQELFARTRRDFSHGCIRVEDPTALAEWVLAGQEGWDRVAIADAMTSEERSQRVSIARPLPVYVLYATAVAGENAPLRFYPDLYGHDAALARALGLAPVGAAPRR